MIVEIRNPSDTVAMEHDDWCVLCLATVLLGEGRYGLDTPDGDERAMPMFICGGRDKWFTEQFGASVEACLETRRAAVADAMDSLLCCKLSGRGAILGLLNDTEDKAKRTARRAKWNDNQRSSTNDIGSRAAAFANSLRAMAKEEEAAGALLGAANEVLLFAMVARLWGAGELVVVVEGVGFYGEKATAEPLENFRILIQRVEPLARAIKEAEGTDG